MCLCVAFVLLRAQFFVLQIFTEEFGFVRGHFGPINTVAFHPDGNGFVTGEIPWIGSQSA